MKKEKITPERYRLPFSERYSPRDRRAIGIAGMALGVFVLYFALTLFRLNAQFDGPTKKVMACVEALYPSTGWGSRRGNPDVGYCYPIGRTELHTYTSIPVEVFNTLQVGDPLPVKYLPGNPTINRIDLPEINVEREESAYGLLAMSILTTYVGAYIFRKACCDLSTALK